MKLETTEIRIRGRSLMVPSVRIMGSTVIASGKWLEVAQLFDEELVEESAWPDPIRLIAELRASPLRADVFTFAGRGGQPTYSFPFEWDNRAVLCTSSFDEWWNGLPQEARKNSRRAAKRGVVVRTVEFDDSLVAGIKRIYDETPVRQGRQFWHYQKELEMVRAMNGTYLERSQFIGAFLGDELIGFIKYIRVDNTAVLIQILATEAYRDERPIYALLKHTVEVCQQQGMSTLIYGKYDYGVNRDSSLTEFKRRTGFKEERFPRYFVPLTLKGKLAVATGLHLGIWNLIPLPVKTLLHKTRTRLLQSRKVASSGTDH